MTNTIADNLQRLVDATDAIGQAIIDAGGTVNEYDRLEEYPADIKSINRNTTSIDITENGQYYAGEENTITTTSFPITIQNSVGTPMKHVTVDGNMQQNGTPSPTTPIQPQETGERTGNLFDISLLEQGGWLASAGTVPTKTTPDNHTYTSRTRYNQIIPLLASTLSLYCPANVKINYVWIDANGISLGGSGYQKNGSTATAPEQAVSMTFILGLDDDIVCTPNDFYDINLVAGSIAPESYEPYGYKIPISSASTTTPVYLGEVPTTRQIKKLVFDGTEDWKLWSSGQSNVERYYYKWGKVTPSQYGLLCTHFPFNTSDGNYDHIRLGGNSREDFVIFISKTIAPAIADFKAYLAAQYANGTPVTVWYVLAEPETTIINEPLRKIGDYADTVSADITLPLSSTEPNIVDVDTSLKPSSASFTYNKKNDYVGYNEINVNVPNTYTSEDEGKVVNNATLVTQTTMPIEITANDTYDTTLYNSIVVNVPSTPIPPFVEVIRYNDNHQPTDIIINNKPDDSLTWMYLSSNIKSIEFKSTPTTTTLSTNLFTSATSLETVYVPWSENEVNGYPWGAPNTTHFVYDYPNISTSRTINYENDTTSTTGSVLNLRAYNMMGRCNVSDDGTITAYYGDTSYTEDGSNGQVMVYIPKFYYKVNITDKQLVDSTKPEYGYDIHEATYSISDIQLDGYKLHPAFINAAGNEVDYVLCSAFEGSTYDTSASVYNTNDAQTVDFTASTGDLLASIGYVDSSGTTVHVKPVSGLTQQLTRPNSMTIAKNRGTGWYALTFKLTSAIQMLITVEYGCNSQTNIANGVIGITDNASYNCASYVGSTVGNTTGRAASTINEINGTETTYTSATTTSVNYRGIENMWGNIWEWVDGINIYGNGSQRGGVPYVCTDMNFSDTNTANYESVGFTVANTDGYVKYFGWGNDTYDWVFMPSTAGSGGASTSTTVGDYFYKTANLNGYRAARLGGSWNHSSRAGVFCWTLNTAASDRTRAVGARLMYIPS